MALSTKDSKALHDACGMGKLHTVKEILMKGGDVVGLLESRFGFSGYTPLHTAACQGHHDILRLLLIYGGDVNTKANGNYTPLHISASMGYVKCIEVLLNNNADIRVQDDFHKTPYQTAVQHRRKDSAKALKSAEIIQAAKDNPEELRNLLNDTQTKDITATCFNDALIEASHFGNFDAVRMLLVTGATNIKHCIGISLRRSHYRVTVLLLVCYAAFEGNITVLENLLGGNFESYEFLEDFVDKSLPKETVVGKIRECINTGIEEHSRVAIQLLAEAKSVDVLKVLLLNTSCHRECRKIDWSTLSLVELNKSWLEAIMSWVEILDLSSNKLISLPITFVDLKLVVRLDLSNNKLKTVPVHLFNLVRLRQLNISGNGINELPETLELRPILKSLNLSDNNLSHLPQSISRSCLETLNLCRNNFNKVPLVICQITSLKYLDLSDNREIDYLPAELGKLRNLTRLELKNLKQITDPPEEMRQNAEDLVGVLRSRLRACEPYYKMKMMLVGKGGHGKTTLVHRLQEDYNFRGNDLTQGVEISDLVIRGGFYRKDFIFNVWDFGGQEDYYATHQCFLSTMSLYLLVWRLIDGEEGVNGLVPWLDNIAVRSPGSTVIIVATHRDCISAGEHGPNYVEHMKFLVNNLVKKLRYNKIQVPSEGIVAISCAIGEGRADINSLRRLIYDTAAGLKKGRGHVMGELIPCSFFTLIERIEKRKMEMLNKKQPPIIRKEEFHAIVQENAQLSRRDVQDPHDVQDATVFLRERGILMHFDDPNKGLNDLYFIDPRWLCSLMARVVTVTGPGDLVKNGILEIESTKLLFRGDDFPFDFYAQYIQLLVSFQIAYLLDETRLLVPSKLPEKKPVILDEILLPFAPVRRAYRIGYNKLHGFWPRFISRFFFYMKEMIAIDSSRYQKPSDTHPGCLAKFCQSCVHVETDSSKFLCILDDIQWETGNVPEREPATRSRSKSFQTTQNKTSVNAREEKRDGQDDDLQALFMDPTVRMFTEEELARGSDNDEIDGMIINNVTTYFKKKERRQKKSKKRSPPTKSTTADQKPAANDETDNKSSQSKNNDTGKRSGSSTTREESPNEKEDVNDYKEDSSHKPSFTSTTSFESEQYDESESEQYARSSLSSISSFRSNVDSFSETDLFPQTDNSRGNKSPGAEEQSDNGRGGKSPGAEEQTDNGRGGKSPGAEEQTVNDRGGKSPGAEGKTVNDRGGKSPGAERQPDNGRGGKSPGAEEQPIVHSSSSLNAILLSMQQDQEEPQGVLTKNDESLSEVAQETTVPSDSSHLCLLRNSDTSHNSSSDESNHLSQDDQFIPKDSDTPHNGTKTDLRTNGNNTAHGNNDDVIDLERRGPNLEPGATNDVTGNKSSITGEPNDINSDSTGDVMDVRDIRCDISNGDTNVKPDIGDYVTDCCDLTDAPITADQGIHTGGPTKVSKNVSEKDTLVPEKDTPVSEKDTPVAEKDTPVAEKDTPISENADIAFTDNSPVSSFSRHSTFCSTSSDNQPLSPLLHAGDDQSVKNDDFSPARREKIESSSQSDDVSESCCQGDDVETELCTLCKENTPVNQLVTIPLDVSELIEKKVLECWRSGIFLNHPEIFLVVSYRQLSDSVVLETAVSPSPLGRRLLTFVVDHLDTLIKEWYPGLLILYGLEPTVQKLIPCRSCEKLGIPRPYKFTFDSCVTQYSMGDFVKCPRHEVNIQDIAPDVVLHDIDADLLLDEHEIVYEKTEANKIGKGNFGKVYRGHCRGKDAAIKEYSTPSTEEDALKRYCEVRKELNVLRRVGQHRFLVNLIGVCLRPFRLVLELAVEGSLEKTLFKKGFLIERVVIYRMIYQVADALSFLHSMNVIYRDLKPENVLVLSYDEAADINIKVTDFGTATFQNLEGLVALEGTAGYHAPEMLQEFSKRNSYDEKVDIFSLAMLIYGFITREKPYYNFTSQAEVNNAISIGKKPDYKDVLVGQVGLASLTLLMEACMEFDPSSRPSSHVIANQVRSPPFQLFLGVIALPCPQSVRHVCVVESRRELWVAVDDKVTNKVLIYELDRMFLKKKFTVNRIRSEDLPVCMQVNCMHVTATDVLIGLRGDLDVVTLHDLVTCDITAKILLPEPVFCLSSNDQYIFLGMSSGVLRIVPRETDGTPMTIEASDHPINCMVAVDKFLWLTAAKCIHIFHTEENDGMCAFELNAVRFSSSRSPCSHAVLSHDKSAVWCVSKGDSVVTGWHVTRKDKITEINCKSVLQSISSDDKPLSPIEVSVTCLLPVLDTVWVGTGGGMLLVLDAQSGELITWIHLLDDHVRTLTLVPGPGPCATEKCFVVASGKNVLEKALCRGGKVVCRLGQEMFKQAPTAPPLTTKTGTKKVSNKSSSRAKSPIISGQRCDTEDGTTDVPISNGSLLFLFEALPAAVLRRIEEKSTS